MTYHLGVVFMDIIDSLVLGIDVGSSAIKFLVSDCNLNEYYRNTVKYKNKFFNDEWVEINPSTWEKIILDEFKIIFQREFSKNIKTICTSAQMHTIIFLDENNTAFRNAIMWNDRRTKHNISEIKKNISEKLPVFLNYQIISTGSPLSNLLWLKDNRPDEYKNIKKICMCKDYINLFLSGILATDYSDASTSCLFDFESEGWSKEICDLYEIDINILPEIFESTYTLGELSLTFKRSLDINHNIQIIVGAGDNSSTVIANNYLTGSELTLSIGTSGVVLCESKVLSEISKNILIKYNGINKKICQTSLSAGGKSLDWWTNDILESHDYLDQGDFDELEIHKGKVIFLPYLEGEKYIYKNPESFGTFYNLSTLSNKKEMTISVMEGVAFALKMLSKNISKNCYYINELTMMGGGAKSDIWTQIIANVFECKVNRFEKQVEAVHGGVVLGFLSMGITIDKNKRRYIQFEPSQNYYPYYQKKFKKFEYLANKINNISKEINEI